jgi:chromosome segregation ATPase
MSPEALLPEIQEMSKNIQKLDVSVGRLSEEVKGMKEALIKQNGRVTRLEESRERDIHSSATIQNEMKNQTEDLKDHEVRDEKNMEGLRKELKDLRKTMYVGVITALLYLLKLLVEFLKG